MFNLGADNADFATANGICVKDYDECQILFAILGLIESLEPGKSPGPITLVKDMVT
jgi:hypothetical protein